MVLNNDPKIKGRTDISDLDSDAIVVFQHRYYGSFMITSAWLFPALVAGLGWGDWWGGLIYAGIVRACFVQQATFCVNSLAHWIGEQPFDDRRTPRDHVLTALVTMGEGYHNFHHEFPSDYRKLALQFLICGKVQLLTMRNRQCNPMVPIRPYKMDHLRPLHDTVFPANSLLEDFPRK
jgi:stearoyl-CoA desaturase (delta-9 desaturase)